MKLVRIAAWSWIVLSIGALTWAGNQINSLRLTLAERESGHQRPSPGRTVTPPDAPNPPVQSSREPTSSAAPRSSPAAKPPAPTLRPAAAQGALRVESREDGTIVMRAVDGTERELTSDEARGLEQSLRAERLRAATRHADGPSYCAGKATGPPDANTGGDSANAWCPAPSRAAGEWLQLKYTRPVEIAEINIHEGYATGALAKVTALLPDGTEKLLWAGTEPVEPPPVERVVKVPPGIRSDQIRIQLDTTRTGTWQEIDAVELVGSDGSRQWAAEGTASSHWGGGEGWALSEMTGR